MDREKLASRREALLKRMNEEFAENYIAAMYQDEEESGMEDGILNVYFEDTGDKLQDSIGQFFFTPVVTDEDTVQYFNAVIFLTEDIDEEKLPKLYEVMSYINFYVPAGSFCVDEKHEEFIYRLACPMPIDLDDDALYDEVQCIIGNAMSFADRFIGYLLGILDGNREISEFLDIINGADDSDN